MTVSTSDIMSAVKNIVTAINGATTAYLSVNGAATATALSAASVVKSSPGRVATVSVTTAASGGVIYDSATASTTRPIYTIPSTSGVFLVNLPVSYGIYVVPGSGQVLTVSYS